MLLSLLGQLRSSQWLPGIVSEAPGLIQLIVTLGVPAVVVAAHQLHLAEVFREVQMPRLAGVPGLGDADGAPVGPRPKRDHLAIGFRDMFVVLSSGRHR